MLRPVILLASLLAAASVIPAQTGSQSSLTTTLAGGFVLNGYVGSNTVFFDVNVLNPNGILVTQLDLRTQLPAGFTLPGTLTVYRTQVGVSQAANRSNAVAWTQMSTTSVPATPNPTVVAMSPPFLLPPGLYGIALHHVNIQAVYTNPTTPVVLPPTFSNADLTIDCTDGRIANSTPVAPFSGGLSAVRTPNVRLNYVTAPRFCNFTASATNGSSPFNVNFTDVSVTSDPGGILVRSWDLDGDSVPDSALPNPSFVYACGTYNVSLTIVDAGGNASETKTGLIVVDAVSASFTWAKTGDPATLTFTDTSTGPRTSWAWDLNGDSVVDSTLQNPTFVYGPGCAPVAVTLTVNNACRNSTVTNQVVPLPVLHTLYNANNAGVAGTGLFFDVNVTNPDGVSICGLYFNANIAGQPMTADIWTVPGTYVGNDLTIGVWTQRSSGPGTSGAFNTPTYCALASKVYLAPGSHGMAVYINGTQPAYSGIGASPAPGATSYSNSDMSLSLGITRSALFGGTLFTPRIFNGSLAYETVTQGLAVYYKFGGGCAGSLGVPGNVGLNLPVVGTTFQWNLTNLNGAGFSVLGLSNTLSILGPLPIDLGILGAPGCPARIANDATTFVFAPTGTATMSLPLPLSVLYLGMHFYTQGVSIDNTVPGNTLGLVTGDANTGVIGL